jgi:hypothetical protein
VIHRVQGAAPQVSRIAVAEERHRARNIASDYPDVRRRVERSAVRGVGAHGRFDAGHVRFEHHRRPTPRKSALRSLVERNLLAFSATVLFVGAMGWCLPIYSELRLPNLIAGPGSSYAKTTSVTDTGRSDLIDTSTYVRFEHAALADATARGESPASIVDREWSVFSNRGTAQNAAPTPAAAPAKTAKIAVPPVHVAAIDSAAPATAAARPAVESVALHRNADIKAKTGLVAFATAPFPYHGMVPGTDRPFLNAGQEGHRGHVSFRGRVFWETETFSDDRVLLHIPPRFDPKRPAVMVVFFHGHGADLARDVRDRQQVPAQITESGANAVLVAPQFAFDAPDSSAGKFWEPDGFKHFLDEAAQKLANLYGDPHSAAAFVKMPIVIVAYSGGFGPTLSVLDRGGVRPRIRGLVLLDALYTGIDNFADWIADNRLTYFVSAYTPHTAQHNADLEHLLGERGVPYGSELRRNHLPGMVTFLPAGDISHRDFVTHAWADNPIRDILARMDDIDANVQTADVTASTPATTAIASKRN